MLSRFIAFIGALAIAITVQAQPLIDRVPDDAVVYIGWRGSDSLGEGYDGSHLQAIIEASQVREFVNEFLPAVVERIIREEPQSAQVARAAQQVTQAILKYPTALYIGDFTAGGPQPTPHLALFIDAGSEADKVLAQLNVLIVAAGRTPMPIKVDTDGSVVRLIVADLPANIGKLADSDPFKSAIAKVQADPSLIVYANVERAVDSADALVSGNDATQWNNIKAALGVEQLHRIIWTAGFDQQQWADRVYIEAPTPRQGLLALLDSAPLSDDAYKLVPASALMATIASFDLSRAYDEIRSALERIDIDSATEFDNAVTEINNALKIDLRADLIEPFGPEWAFYASDEVAGSAFLSTVFVNRANDADRLRQTLAKLAALGNAAIAQNMSGEITLEIKEGKYGDLTYHYLAIPVITPCWAIADGNFYFAYYPQVLESAIRLAHKDGATLADNEAFKQIMTRVQAQEPSAVNYADLKPLMPRNYSSSMMIASLVRIADLFDLTSPPMLLPPLGQILPHLEPAGAASWSDEQGWHFRRIQPFPGSVPLATTDIISAFSMQSTPVMMSILLPSLNRAREAADRVKSASNLRMIAQANFLYYNDNRLKTASALSDLYLTQDIAIRVFVSPRSTTVIPEGLDQDAAAAWIDENSDYVLLRGGTNVTALTSETVWAYEKIVDYDGTNVLFGDGHVEWVDSYRLDELAEEQGIEFLHMDE